MVVVLSTRPLYAATKPQKEAAKWNVNSRSSGSGVTDSPVAPPGGSRFNSGQVQWASSSTGRAPVLHTGGWGFDTLLAYLPL